MRSFFFLLSVGVFLFSCQNTKAPEEKKTSLPVEANCQVYENQISLLESRLLEAEKNADRLEDVIYRLTQNYMVIDNKIRLIQRFKDDSRQKALLKRTAAEINLFFDHSHKLLDSTEADIRRSAIPQTSLIPMIETVRNYLTHQEKLFLEVYGSIGTIQEQVSSLRKTLKTKEKEFSSREEEVQKQLEEKARQARKIHYLVGTREELERSKVVNKSGGFLGVGASLKLSDRLDEAFFQSGDYEIVREIALGNTRVHNLVTTHPKGTYMFLDTPGEKFLKITNPEKFWSTGKFLVLDVDPEDE